VEVKGSWDIKLETLQPSVRQLSRKCWDLNISEPMGLHGQLQGLHHTLTFVKLCREKYFTEHVGFEALTPGVVKVRMQPQKMATFIPLNNFYTYRFLLGLCTM
jgi:hypothetical protein